jgi:hypothetical protein
MLNAAPNHGTTVLWAENTSRASFVLESSFVALSKYEDNSNHRIVLTEHIKQGAAALAAPRASHVLFCMRPQSPQSPPSQDALPCAAGQTLCPRKIFVGSACYRPHLFPFLFFEVSVAASLSHSHENAPAKSHITINWAGASSFLNNPQKGAV